MAKGNLLEISYERVIKSEEIVLTEANCTQYGYIATRKEINGKQYTVFYKEGDTPDKYIPPSIDKDGNAKTTFIKETKQTYSHIAPACSQYDFSYADVDKEGSGRNELTGEMYRERIGNYCMLSISWDLIPNTTEYNNWYIVLTHLPPKVKLKLLEPSGNIVEREMYRGDVSTKLYLFLDDNYQMWQGLTTTFTQWDVSEYDDTVEPLLKEVVPL